MRQLLHRARAHVQAGKPRFAPSREAHLAVLGAFFAAVQTGDVKQVESFLAKDARAVQDGGGQIKTALLVIEGAEKVARLYAGLSRKVDPNVRYEIREVNAWPALIMRRAQVVVGVVSLETDGRLVFGLSSCMNPNKLLAMSRSGGLSRPGAETKVT